MNWVPNEHSRHSWIVGKLQGTRVLGNKLEKKYNLERVFSKTKEAKVFLEPSLFNHCIVIFFPSSV